MLDAPSLSTSTRSTAASGMLLTLTDPPAPPADTASRRPLTSTSTRPPPRPRNETVERPAVDDPAPVALLTEFDELNADTDCIRPSTLVTPLRAMSSRVITVTGKAPSASTRLMAEPVISMRCSCAAAGVARAKAPSAAATAAAVGVKRGVNREVKRASARAVEHVGMRFMKSSFDHGLCGAGWSPTLVATILEAA